MLYFFGLRPCEIDEETKIDGDFLITRNRKRKNGKIEYKKIPIPLQAQGLLDLDKPFVFNCTRITRDRLLKKFLATAINAPTAYCIRLPRLANSTFALILSIFGWAIAHKDSLGRYIHPYQTNLCVHKWICSHFRCLKR